MLVSYKKQREVEEKFFVLKNIDISRDMPIGSHAEYTPIDYETAVYGT